MFLIFQLQKWKWLKRINKVAVTEPRPIRSIFTTYLRGCLYPAWTSAPCETLAWKQKSLSTFFILLLYFYFCCTLNLFFIKDFEGCDRWCTEMGVQQVNSDRSDQLLPVEETSLLCCWTEHLSSMVSGEKNV